MRKIVLCLIAGLLCLMTSRVSAQEELPQWAQDLWNASPTLFDSILYYPADPKYPDTRTYVLYYHQPLKHAQPGAASFPLRALITVYKDTDPTKAVNHIYASGYNLMEDYLANPDSAFHSEGLSCTTEIAHRYHGNYIQIEHRYFQFSAPANCWENLDDLRAEEAAEDFHSLFVALKKTLKGKYVMSGVSKGGITTLLQHRFYPNDMDIFVPYSAPFFDTDRDTLLQKYYFNTGWSKEFRDMYTTIRRNGIYYKNKIFPPYLKMNSKCKTQAAIDSTYWHYLADVASFGFNDHAYSDTLSIRRQMTRNDSIMRAKGVELYGDTVYAYLFSKGVFDMIGFPAWIDTLRKYPEKKQVPVLPRRNNRLDPYGVTEHDWWADDSIAGAAYQYQSKCELGYFDLRFDEILEDPVSAQNFNQFWKDTIGCARDLWSPCFRDLQFNRSLYDETMAATKNATTPIVLIYGLDDSWTGGAVKDEFIGSSVHKFILPAQNHLAAFCSNTDMTQCNAIRSLLDGVLGIPQGIEDVNHQSKIINHKYLKDGQLLILRGDKTYTLTGQEIH